MSKLILPVLTLCLFMASPLHAEGKQIYSDCAKCHGADGKKTTFSRAIGGWKKGKVRQALHDYRAGKRNLRGQGSIMRQRLAGYTDAQIDAVAAYIESLK
ncbi:MAG: c-type cytochrome [Sulfurimonadaceae bacterium]|nr:c-type cytochrome [Sulfurimonadaceae bacterium]